MGIDVRLHSSTVSTHGSLAGADEDAQATSHESDEVSTHGSLAGADAD